MVAATGLELHLDRRADAPLYRQVVAQVRDQIVAGTLRPGDRLPSERSLSDSLGVNRATVVTAYEELAAAGLVTRHVGRGTTVLAPPRDAEDSFAWAWSETLGAGEDRPGLHSILDGIGVTDRISLEAAEPAASIFPVEAVRAIVDDLLTSEGGRLFRYHEAEGISALREQILARYRARDVRTDGRGVLVTSGAMQAIELLVRTLVSPGDTVVVESPTYPGALDALRAAGARLAPVPVDRDGIRTDVLETVLARTTPRLVLVVPAHQNPSGAVLSEARRADLLQLTRRYRVPLVEDAIYSDLAFDGRPFRPLIAEEGAEHVIHLSSLSKTLAGGIRVGWVIAPLPVIERVARLKQHTDVNTSAFLQHIASEAFATGLVDRHLETARAFYQRNCEVLTQALRQACGPAVRFDMPRGGMSLWCRLTLPGSARDFALVAQRRGVSFVPGDAFAVGREQDGGFRLTFSRHDPETLRTAATRIGEAVEDFGQRPVYSRQTGTRPLL